MRYITVLLTLLFFVRPGQTQEDFLDDDYLFFGRKEPMSFGSAFSALGVSTVIVNPATLAFVSDNRLQAGGGGSGFGTGAFFTWLAPNLSISSARQIVRRDDHMGLDHEKQQLRFAFGISNTDIGHDIGGGQFGVGVVFKRQADYMLDSSGQRVAGGHALSIDLGMLLHWDQFTLDAVLTDVNAPRLSHSELDYGRGLLLGGRLTTHSGLTTALQVTVGEALAGSDFGLSFAAEQAFMQGRLIPRLQLTSYFSGSEATMQNVSASVAYRLNPRSQSLALLKDTEVTYALSFLALPNNIGTHLVGLTKYF